MHVCNDPFGMALHYSDEALQPQTLRVLSILVRPSVIRMLRIVLGGSGGLSK